MIRITFYRTDDVVLLKLEGALANGWLDAVETAWFDARRSAPGRRLRVDVRGVCHVDDRGQSLLEQMHNDGAEFVASGFVLPEIIREIQQRRALLERV